MANYVSNLQASTIDILNVIRLNASSDYQQHVPVVEKELDIPRVGEVLHGYPQFANYFVNALVTRIADVVVKNAVFENPYKILKRGDMPYGMTMEEIFVDIAKVRTFSVEKAPAREFKRTLPNIHSLFHSINWRVQYPMTIQDEDLRTAFLSSQGVQDLISKIVDSIYRAAEYDEFLLFKYLIIKAVTKGRMHPVSVPAATGAVGLKRFIENARGISTLMTFMNTKYNAAGVKTATPRDRQIIFIDAMTEAATDVEVLASAFNMDKTQYLGQRFSIDDWTTFDNERFKAIREQSDMIEEVTEQELALMADVRAVLLDKEWFVVYDNLNKFTEDYVASGMYWNYFYNQFKTASSSDFSNAVVFVEDSTPITAPATIKATVASKVQGENATVLNIEPDIDEVTVTGGNFEFIQTQAATQAGVAIHRYGSVMFPPNGAEVTLQLTAAGKTYQAGTNVSPATAQGTEITFTAL